MNWFRRLFKRGQLYRDLSEEIRQHLDEKVEALVQSGLSREAAVAAARREFGNVTSLEERGREVWQWPTIESVLFDIRYALRQLRRQPSFTLVAVLILGLGIGANTAVFSVVDRLLFEPLAFRAPERLDWIMRMNANGRVGRSWEVAQYENLRDMQVFEDLTTYEMAFARSSYKLSGDGEPDRVAGVMVAENFFPFLGISPLLGRQFTVEECRLNGPGAVILSHGFWQRRYSGRSDVIGRQIMVNDRAATIVGVMPASFDFGAVFAPGVRIDLYMPAVFDVLRDWGSTMAVLARHRPGMTADAAQSAINGILARQEAERARAAGSTAFTFVVRPFHESIIGTMRRPMLTLWAAVGLVLLIVCINLANLLLARAAARRKEMALRSAIGASRTRIVRQLLTESFILSIVGGGLGVAVAYAAIAYLRRLEGMSIPLLKNAEINAAALAVAGGVSVLTAVLFGLAPAITAARGNPGEALKVGGRGSGEGGDPRRMRSMLVISEVALACLLLVCTGLLLRSFWHVLDLDLGFQADRMYALRIDTGPSIDSAYKFNAYMRRLMAAARDVPGVESASITDNVPLDSLRSWAVRAPGQSRDQSFGAVIKMVGPGLMETMRTRVIAGREFTDHDDEDGAPVALINKTLADRLWPGQDPVLRTMVVNDSNQVQVVGVVADVRHITVEAAPVSEFYLSILQRRTMSPSLIVRTGRPFAEVAPALRRALNEVVPDLPTANFRPLRQIVDRANSSRRFFVELLMAFAGAALVLAAIGIYGVISYSVARRTPEIGVRMALGATSARIRATVVRDTLRLALTGAVVGIAAAIAVSSVLASLLFGVSRSDPWTYAIAAAVLLMVAIAAGAIPAIRASRISPMRALRAD
jgi:predicted permease